MRIASANNKNYEKNPKTFFKMKTFGCDKVICIWGKNIPYSCH